MSLFGALNISASGLTAQQARMDVLSQNVANVDTTRTADGTPYKRKTVIFQERTNTNRPSFLTTYNSARAGQNVAGNGVRVSSIQVDASEGAKVYEPGHPDADADGYVEKPNVNIVTEMVNMIAASRSYEANVTAMGVTKSMINKTFEISRT